MTHSIHVIDGVNKDLTGKSREYYLELADGFKSSFGQPIVKQEDGFNIIDESVLEVGSKARFGELLVSHVMAHELVYVQPRFGFAGVSLTKLCQIYNKSLTLFMPACKEISEHQAYCIEKGCKPMFKRVAAMPNLNKLAYQYAKENQAFFIPFGLQHEMVTAMIVKTCEELKTKGVEPETLWCAISTGVLCRGLQIGFPNSKINAVAVARNLKAGESGRATVFSYHRKFEQRSEIVPPFDSALNYDAKAYEYMIKYGKKDDWFWNVAGNIFSKLDKRTIKSYKEWGEK